MWSEYCEQRVIRTLMFGTVSSIFFYSFSRLTLINVIKYNFVGIHCSCSLFCFALHILYHTYSDLFLFVTVIREDGKD